MLFEKGWPSGLGQSRALPTSWGELTRVTVPDKDIQEKQGPRTDVKQTRRTRIDTFYN